MFLVEYVVAELFGCYVCAYSTASLMMSGGSCDKLDVSTLIAESQKVELVYDADARWCKRNFLHRFSTGLGVGTTSVHLSEIKRQSDLRKAWEDLGISWGRHTVYLFQKSLLPRFIGLAFCDSEGAQQSARAALPTELWHELGGGLEVCQLGLMVVERCQWVEGRGTNMAWCVDARFL